MLVEVEWSHLEHDDDSLWDAQLCLYVYLHPTRDWLLYVGKADFSTVRKRLAGKHKEFLFRDLHDKYGVNEIRVLHGNLSLVDGGRRTSALLSDVESLLITRLKPFGNIISRNSRIQRPGMRVHCTGDWPFNKWRFHDRAS